MASAVSPSAATFCTSRVTSAGLYPNCCNATVASPAASSGRSAPLGRVPGRLERPSIRSRSSMTMRSAVFLPTPGTLVSATTSPVCTSRAK
ncbi:MAG: hypothetical protein WDW38_006625 [Sanguina aurantia]